MPPKKAAAAAASAAAEAQAAADAAAAAVAFGGDDIASHDLDERENTPSSGKDEVIKHAPWPILGSAHHPTSVVTPET